MFTKQTVFCPVCRGPLGYASKGEVCSFVCSECRWIFTWDSKGNIRPPVKLDNKKPDICDCGSCQYRDEQIRAKNLSK